MIAAAKLILFVIGLIIVLYGFTINSALRQGKNSGRGHEREQDEAGNNSVSRFIYEANTLIRGFTNAFVIIIALALVFGLIGWLETLEGD